ncbi:hypothetical protein GCM10027416_08540 [Okibacterium endophyticum]
MNRTSVALLAALEALLTVAIGISIALVPLTLLWAVEFGFAVDWTVFWHAAVDTWLLGNGADLHITLPPDYAASLGVAEAATGFMVSLTPLAFAALTVYMGFRTGRRGVRTGPWITAGAVSLVVFAALTVLVNLSAHNDVASVSWGMVLPTAVYALGLATGIIGQHLGENSGEDSSFLSRFGSHNRDLVVGVLRGGLGAVTILIGVSGALLAVLVFANFGLITGLYETGQPTVVGATMTTLAQLAFLPNAVIWVASWLVGPGFALGAGTSVSPVDTVVGPVPAVPLLGVVPTGDFVFGFVGLVVPLLAGFIAAMAVRPRLAAAIGNRSPIVWLSIAAAGIGVVSGVILGLLAWFSHGAAGPGRLADVGPNALLVGLVSCALVTVAALIGMASGSHRPAEHPARR